MKHWGLSSTALVHFATGVRKSVTAKPSAHAATRTGKKERHLQENLAPGLHWGLADRLIDLGWELRLPVKSSANY